MNVLLICRPRDGVDPSSSFPSHLAAERAELRRLRKNGTLSAAYSPAGGPGAVLMLDVPDHDTADRIAAELPLAIAGLIDTETIELHPLEM
jgi:muconolactone delta-isomerase